MAERVFRLEQLIRLADFRGHERATGGPFSGACAIHWRPRDGLALLRIRCPPPGVAALRLLLPCRFCAACCWALCPLVGGCPVSRLRLFGLLAACCCPARCWVSLRWPLSPSPLADSPFCS